MREKDLKIDIMKKKILELKQKLEDIKNDIFAHDEGDMVDTKDHESLSKTMGLTQFRSTFHSLEQSDLDNEEFLMEELNFKRSVQENLKMKSDQVFDNIRLLVYRSKIKIKN